MALATKIEVASGQSWDRPSSKEGLPSSESPLVKDSELRGRASPSVKRVPQDAVAVPSTSDTGCPSTKRREDSSQELADHAAVPAVEQQLDAQDRIVLPVPAALSPVPGALRVNQQMEPLLPVPALRGACSAPLVLADEGDMVHLGNNIRVPKAKLDDLARKLPKKRFIKDLCSSFYTHEELCKRSVTGEPCRSLLKNGAEGKVPLTPTKLAALASGLLYYESSRAVARPRDGPELHLFVRKLMTKFLPDNASQGQRKRAPPLKE